MPAPPIDSASVLPSIARHRLARPRPHPIRGLVRDLAARALHRDRLPGGGVAARAHRPPLGRVHRDRERGRVLVADRRDHRLAAVLRDRPLLRVRQRRPDARDLARRHLAAGRHRRRGHHQRVPGAARGLPVLPGRRPGGSGTGPGDRGGADRRPHHRRPHRPAHELVPGLALRGRHAGATVRVRQRAVPGGAPGRPSADDRPIRSQAARREGRGDRRRRGRPSDGPLRHDHRRGALPVPVVRDDAEAAPRGHPHPDVRPLVRDRADPGGLAADRQTVLRAHRQPVDGRRRGDRLRGDPAVVGTSSRSRGAERRGTGATRGPDAVDAIDAGTGGDLDEPEPTGPATSSA